MESIESILERAEPVFKSIVRSNKKCSCEVGDVLQDVRVHVWKHYEKYNPLRSSLDSYVDRLARYAVKQHTESHYQPLEESLELLEEKCYGQN